MTAFNDPSREYRPPARKPLSPFECCVNMIYAPGGTMAPNYLPPDGGEPCPEPSASTPLFPLGPVIAFNDAQHSKSPASEISHDQTVIEKSSYDYSGAKSTSVSPSTCITNMTYDPGKSSRLE